MVVRRNIRMSGGSSNMLFIWKDPRQNKEPSKNLRSAASTYFSSPTIWDVTTCIFQGEKLVHNNAGTLCLGIRAKQVTLEEHYQPFKFDKDPESLTEAYHMEGPVPTSHSSWLFRKSSCKYIPDHIEKKSKVLSDDEAQQMRNQIEMKHFWKIPFEWGNVSASPSIRTRVSPLCEEIYKSLKLVDQVMQVKVCLGESLMKINAHRWHAVWFRGWTWYHHCNFHCTPATRGVPCHEQDTVHNIVHGHRGNGKDVRSCTHCVIGWAFHKVGGEE